MDNNRGDPCTVPAYKAGVSDDLSSMDRHIHHYWIFCLKAHSESDIFPTHSSYGFDFQAYRKGPNGKKNRS